MPRSAFGRIGFSRLNSEGIGDSSGDGLRLSWFPLVTLGEAGLESTSLNLSGDPIDDLPRGDSGGSENLVEILEPGPFLNYDGLGLFGSPAS